MAPLEFAAASSTDERTRALCEIMKDSEFRKWTLEYNEKLTVMTEPPGARIYVTGITIGADLIGVSPVQTVLDGGALTAAEYGKYPKEQRMSEDWLGDRLEGPTRRAGEILWSGRLTSTETRETSLTIRAFKEGYRPAEQKWILGRADDPALQRAIEEYNEEHKLPSNGTFAGVVTAENSTLIVLERDPGPPKQAAIPEASYRPAYPVRDPCPPSGSHGSSRSRGDYAAAKREYDVALSGYEKAMVELDNAKNMRSMSNLSLGTMMQGSKLDRVAGLLGQGSTHLSLQDAERNVQIARERLERAKARFDAANWK